MVKSRVAENGRQIKRGNKKKKRKVLKIFLFVLLFFIIILGAVGGKVYFDLKTAVTKAYVNPPTQMTSISLKKKEPFTTAILGISKIDGKDVLVSANLAATNPRLQQTTVINLSTSAILPDKQTLLTLYNSKGEAAVIKEMEKLLQVKINKFVGMNFDQMGELVQAIGGVSIQNANEFSAQGFKFPQGTVALNKAEEVAAYFTLLNAGDTKKAFARQQEVVMAVVSKLKSPRVLIRHYGQILTAFPKVFKQVLTLEMLRL
ncbi:Transcriptional regulator LytR [Lactococcus lactis]|nr:Transcriptional regulator LytR [Lactococcus lactis]